MKLPITLTVMIVALSHALLFENGRLEACSRIGPVSHLAMCSRATVIVRATALEYLRSPVGDIRTTGTPESVIRFEVEEVLKGSDVPRTLSLHGYLSDEDDFNDNAVPYTIVRPNGRRGSCYANTYKRGAEFLLFLDRGNSGFTLHRDALAPVNEQLHASEDPWLSWVKGYLQAIEDVKPKNAE